jgi:hypothetical protein
MSVPISQRFVSVSVVFLFPIQISSGHEGVVGAGFVPSVFRCIALRQL